MKVEFVFKDEVRSIGEHKDFVNRTKCVLEACGLKGSCIIRSKIDPESDLDYDIETAFDLGDFVAPADNS